MLLNIHIFHRQIVSVKANFGPICQVSKRILRIFFAHCLAKNAFIIFTVLFSCHQSKESSYKEADSQKKMYNLQILIYINNDLVYNLHLKNDTLMIIDQRNTAEVMTKKIHANESVRSKIKELRTLITYKSPIEPTYLCSLCTEAKIMENETLIFHSKTFARGENRNVDALIDYLVANLGHSIYVFSFLKEEQLDSLRKGLYDDMPD